MKIQLDGRRSAVVKSPNLSHGPLAVAVIDRIEKLAASRPHRTKVAANTVVVGKIGNLCGQKSAYLDHGINAVPGHFHLIGIVEHPAVFQKGNHIAGNGDMGLGWVPVDPENRRANTGQPVDDLLELQNLSHIRYVLPGGGRTP